jgi:hypothetical protein
VHGIILKYSRGPTKKKKKKKKTLPLFSSRVTNSGKSQLADPPSLFKKRIRHLQNFTSGRAGEEQWNV